MAKSNKHADIVNDDRTPDHGERPENASSAARPDSWVDATATLLATIVFGLGWVLVELERAEPPSNRYDLTASEMWVGAVATSIEARALEAAAAGRRGDEDPRWIERALQRSNR